MGIPLTDVEKVDARRFSGYAAFGSGANDGTFNRYFISYRTLEYRMANLQDAEIVVVRSKLAELNILDQAISAAGANLDTDQAAVWHHNRDEVAHRASLFSMRRMELVHFLGIPPGPNLSGRGSIRMVV